MDFEELKRQANHKVLFYGRSRSGKTRAVTTIALEAAHAGLKVKYVDTESDGSMSLVNLIERGDYKREAVRNIEYIVVDNYDELVSNISKDSGSQDKFDLIIVDTLDHKHTFALRKVTDAKVKSDADWNEYPMIYSTEKQIMEIISKPDTNFVATLDPESGSMDKPKGAQANILGFFSVVVRLQKDSDTYAGTIENWIGRDDVIGATKKTDDVVGAITERVTGDQK